MTLSEEIAKFTSFVHKCARPRVEKVIIDVIRTETEAILSAVIPDAVIQYRVITSDSISGLAKTTMALPPEPTNWSMVSREFLNAMHEAGRATGDGHSRYTLHRIQILGSAGRVVASDSQLAYIHRGFHFPFKNDLFVPAISLFGSTEFRQLTGEVRIGHTEKHFVVRVEPWTVYLTLDPTGRFPNLAGLIPKASRAVELTIADSDGTTILSFMKDAQDKIELNLRATGPITLKSSPGCVLSLPQSRTRGTGVFAINRRHFEKGLKLGCRTLRFESPGHPLAMIGRTITILSICHESPFERNNAMKPTTVNDSAPPPEDFDPLVEAEALRTSVVEIGQRLAKLLTWLKSHRKEKKAISQVWSSLKSLNLRS